MSFVTPAVYNSFNGLLGPDLPLLPEDLQRYVHQDLGLSQKDRAAVLRMLNTPDIMGNLAVGASGAALALAVARWKKMPPTGQALMSLAGFGLGNIILNKLSTPGRNAEWNPERGTNRILL
jgi:hypothetical protein